MSHLSWRALCPRDLGCLWDRQRRERLASRTFATPRRCTGGHCAALPGQYRPAA